MEVVTDVLTFLLGEVFIMGGDELFSFSPLLVNSVDGFCFGELGVDVVISDVVFESDFHVAFTFDYTGP